MPHGDLGGDRAARAARSSVTASGSRPLGLLGGLSAGEVPTSGAIRDSRAVSGGLLPGAGGSGYKGRGPRGSQERHASQGCRRDRRPIEGGAPHRSDAPARVARGAAQAAGDTDEIDQSSVMDALGLDGGSLLSKAAGSILGEKAGGIAGALGGLFKK